MLNHIAGYIISSILKKYENKASIDTNTCETCIGSVGRKHIYSQHADRSRLTELLEYQKGSLFHVKDSVFQFF